VVGDTLPAVGDTVGSVGDAATDLLGALGETPLLDVNADLAADLDLAAPISAGVALNANAAVPIDAAVSANALSPDATSLASAPQDSLLEQALVGQADANSTQDSTLDQGETTTRRPRPADTGGGSGDAALSGPRRCCDLDVNLDLALDLAAPINAALAANANIAAPIDAAVSANILSPDSTSLATADQNSVIVQTLQGVANATTDQTSAIDQGETTTGGGA
jgi:hypothetical protein